MYVFLHVLDHRQLVFNAEGQVIGKLDISKSIEQRLVHDAYYQPDNNRESMYRMLPIQATNSHLLYHVYTRGNETIR